jgi:endonuclease/exonuclease/phosphatase family metal-dependent hydrolase
VTRAVSFNIQHARRPDGVVDTDLLATTCAGFDADVLALQEVDRTTKRSGGLDQAAVVADACGLSFAFGEAIPGYGNALLVRGELTDVETVALPHTPEREPRVALLGRGAGLSIACVHLGLRGDAVPQLPVVIAALTERPPPHLLLGDFNLERRKVAVWPLALVDDPGPTFPAHRPRRRIDHVAVSGLRATRVAVLPRPPLSDHRPLLAELEPTSP